MTVVRRRFAGIDAVHGRAGAVSTGLGAAKMLKSIKENPWLRQITLFVVYGVIYAGLRPYSDSLWSATCGLRMACLLLLPYRYWPTLALAELGPLIYQNYPYLASYGPVWTMLNSIPPILYAMPVVWWSKHRLALFPSRRTIRVSALFTCVALVSVVWTAVVFAILATVIHPTSAPHPYAFRQLDIVQIFLGRYAGIITLVPLALVIKLQPPTPWQSRLRDFLRSRLTLETTLLLLPSLAVLTWLCTRAPGDAQQVIRISMFLLAAWLTVKHGWRAAAVSIAAVMACIFLNIPAAHNVIALVGEQASIAFAATCLFALGAYVTEQNVVEEQEHLDRAALKFAQQSVYQCEMRLRQAAQTLEQVGGTLQLTQTRLLNRFKHMLPITEGQNYYRQAATTQHQLYRLAESMYPTAWRERGLPAALRETIGRALDEAGLGYRFDMKGRGLSQLSPSVHSAIYRMACEAIAYVCEQQPSTTVILSLRGGLTHEKRWAVVRAEGLIDVDEASVLAQQKPERQQLATKLGATGLGIAAMRDHVRLYRGGVHVRKAPGKYQITALIHDTSHATEDASTTSSLLELCIR
jgi:two-component system, NarL family, sensor histidine kinase FusK